MNSQKPESRPVVLLIDDDEDQLSVFEMLIQKGQYEVRTARSAEEALETLNDNPIDIIVCDVFLPKVRGPEFVTIVRNLTKSKSIPIITFSAAEESLQERLLKAGADVFVHKRHASTELLRQIDLLLNSKRGPRPV